MSGIVTVYATFGSDAEAVQISRTLVEERLAACANVLGACRSIYRWKGDIEDAAEVAVLYKTTAARAPELIARLTELHSYEVPAAVVWPIAEASAPYAEWVAQEVSAGTAPANSL